MREDDKHQKLLNLVCSGQAGVTMAEAMIQTELNYRAVMDAVKELCAAGHRIGVVKVGRSVFRLYPLEVP